MLINGDDLYANYAAYRASWAMSRRTTSSTAGLIVRDALIYAAELRLPDATPEEIKQRVNEALEQVEMTPHAGKQVGRLSGGQRKRVSIAVELLAGPGLFFLDEPTSGLDPGLEKKMMYTLRKLADGGRTVVLVTHATANITQCTHVAFMADGRLVCFGPPQEALEFFGSTDFRRHLYPPQPTAGPAGESATTRLPGAGKRNSDGGAGVGGACFRDLLSTRNTWPAACADDQLGASS